MGSPISEEQLSADRAWNVEYLKRLKRENVDQSCLNADLEACKLTPEQVFGAEIRTR